MTKTSIKSYIKFYEVLFASFRFLSAKIVPCVLQFPLLWFSFILNITWLPKRAHGHVCCGDYSIFFKEKHNNCFCCMVIGIFYYAIYCSYLSECCSSRSIKTQSILARRKRMIKVCDLNPHAQMQCTWNWLERLM